MEHDANGSERIRILVWDLPVRLFHWLLSAGFAAALLLATLASDDGPVFPLHMIIGLVLAFMVVLRIVWGFIGTHYARFRSFLFGPFETTAYLRSAARREGGRHYTGHNPGASWAIYAMLALILGTGITGWMSAQGAGDALEELHELLAWSTVAVVAIHVLGVIAHVVMRRENVVLAMISGRKRGERGAAIPSPRAGSALVFLLLTGWWAASLFAGYDPVRKELEVPLTGTRLTLGEDGEEDRQKPDLQTQSEHDQHEEEEEHE